MNQNKISKNGESYALFPERIAGVKRNEKGFMDFLEARGGSELLGASASNPHFMEGDNFNNNCQTCVVAYEARRRGYNVEAKPYQPGRLEFQELLLNSGIFAYINIETGDYVKERRIPSSVIASRMYKFLDSRIEEGQRFEIEFDWDSPERGEGHIVALEKANGILRIYDPQSNAVVEGPDQFFKYFSRVLIGPGKPGVFFYRVDNAAFSSRVDEILLEGRGSS